MILIFDKKKENPLFIEDLFSLENYVYGLIEKTKNIQEFFSKYSGYYIVEYENAKETGIKIKKQYSLLDYLVAEILESEKIQDYFKQGIKDKLYFCEQCGKWKNLDMLFKINENLICGKCKEELNDKN